MYKVLLFLILTLFGACQTTAPQTLTVNDVMLEYVINGNGPPLYLLHGGMESRASFQNQIPAFAKSFTVIALDSREQGRSGNAKAQISYELMSKDVIALAQHLGHDRIAIMGLSDGAVTALTTAIHNPDLVDALVLLGPNFHYSAYPPETRDFIAGYEWDGETDPEKYPGNFVKHYLTGHEDLSGFGDLLKEMSVMWTTSPTFTTSDLSAISARTLIINGDHEDTALDHILELYNAIPKANLFVVPNATHYALEEKSELLNTVAMEFLRAE